MWKGNRHVTLVILTIDTQRMHEEGSRYLLKSISYDSVSRLDMTQLPFEGMESYVKTLPITQDKPWVMQELKAKSIAPIAPFVMVSFVYTVVLNSPIEEFFR